MFGRKSKKTEEVIKNNLFIPTTAEDKRYSALIEFFMLIL